jgi:ABC-2 type transport system permease protein
MRLYWELFRLSFRRQMAYRAANYAGLVTNLFFGLLRASVLIALYAHRKEVSGISLEGAVTYTGLTQAIIAFLHLFGVDMGIVKSISSGEVANDLLKPLSFYGFWLARDLGKALVGVLIRGIVIMGAYAVFFPIVLPRSAFQWVAFIVALMLGWWISFSWRFLVNSAAFWTPNAIGIGRVGYGLALFLCGFLVPLRFFPDWFARFCAMTPFPSMVNTVVEVYLGVLPGPRLYLALLTQLIWVLALAGICHGVTRAGVRRLVIQGG